MQWLRSIPVVATSLDDAAKPDIAIDDIFQIDAPLIKKHEIKNLIFDIDQTIVPQGQILPSKREVDHLKLLGSTLEGTICFLTNEPNEQRSIALKDATGFAVVASNRRKPEPDAFANALNHLGVNASKHVAMVGDRRWTDILGANKAGLLSILVNPISPSKDRLGASIARNAESYAARASKYEYFLIFGILGLLTLLGTATIAMFIYVSATGQLQFLNYLSSYASLCALGFIFLSAAYFRYVSVSRSKVSSPENNVIADYFNTYPLALRFFASLIILALILTHVLKQDENIQIGLVFCIFTMLMLVFSLFPFYHNQGMRVLRIVLDMLLVFYMASSLEGYYKFIAVAYLCVPIATSARYFGVLFSITIVTLSVAILVFFLNGFEKVATPPKQISDEAFYMIIFVFGGCYVMTALALRLEYGELQQPFLEISRHFENIPQENRLHNYLKAAARSINCSGIAVVRLFEGGVFYFAENHLQYGAVSQHIAEEIGNFLRHAEKLHDLDMANQADINKHSAIVRNLESTIKPPVRNGITSAIAISVPHMPETVFIAINPLSRNGTIRSQFSVNSVAVVKVFALGVGASISPFIQNADFNGSTN